MASKGRLQVAKTRTGRRPLRATTLLKKEKEGTLYKYTKVAEPGPPKGVSTDVWDKRLQYGPGERAPTPLHRRIERMRERKGLTKKAYTLQGHTNVQGLNVAIENRKGSVRKGTDKDGNEWRTKMKNPYGYIVGTKGADDEPVDAYVGPDKKAPNAYVVHQHKDNGKGYDEDKVMLGFKTEADAKKAYLKHYDSPKFLGPVSTVPIEDLKEKVKSKKKLVKISEAALFDELFKLSAIDKKKFEEMMLKKPKTKRVTAEEATKSLSRLRKLERSKATPGQIARSAGVGAIVGPVATLASRIAAGKKGRVGLPIWRGKQEMGSTAAYGAVFGGLLPAGRQKLERGVEKQKLREYVGERKRGTLRGKIRKATGL